MTSTRNVGIYTRISQDRSGEALGVARQEEDCKALAEQRGWTVTEVYTDNDMSASAGKKPRPNWERLLADLESGKVTGIVAYSASRMYRNLADFARLSDIGKRMGTAVATVVSGDMDFTKSDSSMIAGILAVIDQGEASRTGDRQTRKQRELREAGKYGGGGPRRYGYGEDRITIVPEEADNIRQWATRIVAGEGVRSIVRDLNARGIPSASGGRWSRTSLTQIVTSYRIIGIRSYKGEPVLDKNDSWVKAEWEPILTADVGQRIRDMVENRKVPGRKTETYPLGGFVFCGVCGARMHGNNVTVWKGAKKRHYVCPDDHAAIIAEDLEAEVAFQTAARTVTVERLQVIDPKTIAAERRDELTTIIQNRSAIDKMFADGDLKPDTYKRQTRDLNEREAALRASLPTVTIDPTAVSTVADLVERIEVQSARALNDGKRTGKKKMPIEDRVHIEWQPGVVVKPEGVTTHPQQEEAHCTIVRSDGTPCDKPGPYVKAMCYGHYHRTKKYGNARADIQLGEHVGRNAAAAFK